MADKETESRAHASLHCKKYKECLSKVGKAAKPMRCYRCKEHEFENNTYRKGISSVFIAEAHN